MITKIANESVEAIGTGRSSTMGASLSALHNVLDSKKNE
jgi:hypothetical protein